MTDSDEDPNISDPAGPPPLDTGQPGSGHAPPATSPALQERYLAETFTQGTQTEQYSFSPGLCLELVNKLTNDQLKHEISRIFHTLDEHTRQDFAIETKTKSENRLKTHFLETALSENVDFSYEYQSLIAHVSRHAEHAGRQIAELTANIEAAQAMVRDLQCQSSTANQTLLESPLITVVPTDRPTDGSDARLGNDSQQSQGTEPRPFYFSPEQSPFDYIDVQALDSSTDYDRIFRNRKVAHYGTLPYRYPGGNHPARDITTNPHIQRIDTELRAMFPEATPFNSFTVTKYDTHHSNIPPHSDDEPCIEPNSVILTITAGAARPVVFRRKPPATYERHEITPQHGTLYMMTRESQDHYDHCVPRVEKTQHNGPRISITCRILREPPPPTRPNRRIEPRPKRVLILSDSKNTDFDCALFKEPIIAFRRNLYYLRDIHDHRTAIEQADLVLISAGINDIKFNQASPVTLHSFIRDSVAQYPTTQFLFDAISPLSINADRYNQMNARIDHVNELILKLSIRTANIKLFDNVSFGLSHLARDGLHLNETGKRLFSDCWVHCILIGLGLRKCSYPLRQKYHNIVNNFYSIGG